MIVGLVLAVLGLVATSFGEELAVLVGGLSLAVLAYAPLTARGTTVKRRTE
ncbi:hypothetical protein AB7C87_11215 [Natrarchaeobius sp. A-rgal3]|uniref:hypothetical protein n=1 Tax=Natrarchaeobius versutus TaxID=1679078 RepID=UPI003510819F